VSKTGAVIATLLVISACGSVVSKGPASSARTPAQSQPTLSADSGQITGTLGYPAGVLPAETVYAVATDGSRFFTSETVFGQRTYTILGITPGDYFVLTVALNYIPSEVSSAARMGSASRFPAGYTKSVPCGLSINCNDHTLIPVHVSAGAAVSGIDPGDWYAPMDSFPLIPPSGAFPSRPGVPDISTASSLPTFQDPKQATTFIASAVTRGRYVSSSTHCPINIACVWSTAERDGQSAADFGVVAGSNGTKQNCAIYLVKNSSGWQGLGGNVFSTAVCSLTGSPFPGVGESGQIQMALGETGCVNVHSAPSLSANVVGCMAKGTDVAIDDGPAYVPAKPPLPQSDLPWALDYWWHIAGKGWVVHAYLLTRHYG
jgi:hypothetical protein